MSHTQAVITLSRSDLADVTITPTQVIAAVEEAYRGYVHNPETNPRKLHLNHTPSISYALLGATNGVVGFKTSYTNNATGSKSYYTTLSLYDEDSGLPLAMMDAGRIGALRTPAVSAILARELAPSHARTALIIGTGVQGQALIPFLLTAVPTLERIQLLGTHPDGIAAVRHSLKQFDPDRTLTLVTEEQDACEAQIILAVAGPSTPFRLTSDNIQHSSVSILVGHGLAPEVLWSADRVIATNAEQMALTGLDFAHPQRGLRVPDSELPKVLLGLQEGRTHENQRIFAYNSGMVITDVAVGAILARHALSQGRGHEVALWQ